MEPSPLKTTGAYGLAVRYRFMELLPLEMIYTFSAAARWKLPVRSRPEIACLFELPAAAAKAAAEKPGIVDTPGRITTHDLHPLHR
jgi:hypothetical protein